MVGASVVESPPIVKSRPGQILLGIFQHGAEGSRRRRRQPRRLTKKTGTGFVAQAARGAPVSHSGKEALESALFAAINRYPQEQWITLLKGSPKH